MYLYTLNFNSIIILGIHFEFKYKGIATKKNYIMKLVPIY